MRKKLVSIGLLGLLIFGAGTFAAFAGDSLYGTVTEVKRADVVVLDYGKGRYNVRIIGIDVPRDATRAAQAKEFVARLVLRKNVRLRFEGRNKNGEMVGRLQTDDREIGIKDVGLELVKAGMARRQANYDYKNRALSAAEDEARRTKRGLWSLTQPK
ncbi:MAG TPA: thermonuclease family protein [Pyrinomonadaceae bacterium]|jgi:endonuclease YncB( thermonuclease family)